MKDKLDKTRIELYGNGIFQGYVKSVSLANQKVISTPNKYDAKTYGTQTSIDKEITKIGMITHGGLTCRIG